MCEYYEIGDGTLECAGCSKIVKNYAGLIGHKKGCPLYKTGTAHRIKHIKSRLSLT